jgi:adenylate cyclase
MITIRRILRGASIGLVAGGLAAAAAHLPLVDTWERRTLDLRIRGFADPSHADPAIVAVVVDQKSLDAIAAPRGRGGLEQGWPWPRDYYAAVLRYLFASGARAAAFDLLFSEKSIYTHLGVAEDDADLAAASAKRPVVQAVMFTREATGGQGGLADRAWPEALRDPRRGRPLAARPALVFNKATLPIPPLVEAAAAVGWIGFEPDEDGTFRSLRPAAAYAPDGSAEAVGVWSLSLALAELIGARVDVAADPPARDPLRVGGRPVPLGEDGRVLLRFHGGEDAYRQFSFVSVLQSAKRAAAGLPIEAARPADFAGKIVFIGASAAGLLDLRATPVSAVLPGYLVHATALDNLLHGDVLRRATARTRFGIAVVLGIVCGALVAARASLRWKTLTALGVGAVYTALAVWSFAHRGVWLDLVSPAVAVALAYAGASGYGYLTEGRERRFLRDAFSRYLAPEIVEELVANPERLALGGETRDVTVMFADVAGFTTLSEGRAPAEIVRLMNDCFTEITAVIQGHGGTVDKFIGDAVMAFWNAPVQQADHAARACRAARDLLSAIERLSRSFAERNLPRLAMRVGLATGPALVGNVGSRSKFNYTVMGDTVNLASRLEGAAKVYGTASLIAGTTVDAARRAADPSECPAMRELDWLQVKGKTEPVTIFEVLPAEADVTGGAGDKLFAEGLGAYRDRRFAEAVRAFEAALAADPGDRPAREMLDRCREFLVTPPPANWRGTHVLVTK